MGKLKLIFNRYVYAIRRRIEIWKIRKTKLSRVEGVHTSISDDFVYPCFCRAAAENNGLFKKFRRSAIYNAILEHVTYEQGEKYINEIEQLNSKISENDWKGFLENDRVGSPRTYAFQIKGQKMQFSPTTLRYVKVYVELDRFFDFSEIKKVAEIGIGYGGQCRIIKSKNNIIEYVLYDLPEVLQLAAKYLSHYENMENIQYVDAIKPLEYPEQNYDLCISNYAFCELKRDIQEEYLQRVVLKSAHGYITWSDLAEKAYGSYSVKELMEVLPQAHIVGEKPLTHEGNVIIVW